MIKKRDAVTAINSYRLWEASSAREAGIAFIGNYDPELAERLTELEQNKDRAKSASDLTEWVRLNMVMAASSLLKWMKTNGYYGDTLADALFALYEFEPTLHQKLITMFPDRDFHEDGERIPLKRIQWMHAIEMSLVAYNGDTTVFANGPKKEASPEFSLFYVQVLSNLWHIVRFDRGLVQPVKTSPRKGEDVYLKRIEDLTAQLDTLREENDKLRSKERKAVDSLVVPLERELRNMEDQVAKLQTENATLREIQECLAQQDEYVEELLELPATGVTFIGGSPQLRAKVSLAFPDWKVIDSADKVRVRDSQDIVFLYTDYISHSTASLARKRANWKPLFCHGTNWERLERSMRSAYTLHGKDQCE